MFFIFINNQLVNLAQILLAFPIMEPADGKAEVIGCTLVNTSGDQSEYRGEAGKNLWMFLKEGNPHVEVTDTPGQIIVHAPAPKQQGRILVPQGRVG